MRCGASVPECGGRHALPSIECIASLALPGDDSPEEYDASPRACAQADMARLRSLLIDLTPPVLVRLVRQARGRHPNASSARPSVAVDGALSPAERAALVARMDAGDYDFDAD